jgi:NAD(P)-dependent dehydrogenase (short-subunit alcohol dehydrogenase family)
MAGFPGAHEGRVAVVTGAAMGLGRAYAERLARDGARVVVADIEHGEATVESILAAGGEAVAVTCDVTSEAAVEDLSARVDDTFGGCDILVNNAGIFPNVAWEEVDLALWRRVISVNLESMFLTCKAFWGGMRDRGFGRIINISSNTFGLVVPGRVPYISSKAGVIGLTRALASDLAEHGITANSVLPGLTMTGTVESMWGATPRIDKGVEMQAIKRRAMPQDLEGIVSFLATEDARWITGQSIVVDGGIVRH